MTAMDTKRTYRWSADKHRQADDEFERSIRQVSFQLAVRNVP